MARTSGLNKTREDWQDFPSVAAGTFLTATTSNPTYGNVLLNRAQWRKDKGDLLIRWDFLQNSSGTNGNGTYLINIPSSIGVIDTTKITPNSGNGTAKVGDSYSYSNNPGSVFVYSSTQLAMIVATAIGSSSQAVGSAYSGLGNAPQYYSLIARVPIVGWSAND